MRHDEELDRVLADDERILPSSGFAGSVMEAVRREASTPPPIPFPWNRALPGLATAALTLLLALVHVSAAPGRGPELAQLGPWLSSLVPFVRAAVAAGAHWIALVLLLTYASVKLSMRLARPA